MKKILVMLGLLFVFSAYCADVPVWVEAEGSSVMGDADTLKETALRAVNDAKRNALEDASGIFIKSLSMVSNSQLADDLVYASVRGKILKSQTISQGFDAENQRLYRVKLRVLIEPYHPEKQTIYTADLALSKTVINEGERITLSYKVNENSYVYLFSVAADGSVTLLLPNSLERSNYAEKGKVYLYPDKESKIVLTAQFLPGFKGREAVEKVKIIATKGRADLLSLGFQEGMFITYDAKSTGMISDLMRRLNQLDPSEWTENSVSYKIVRN